MPTWRFYKALGPRGQGHPQAPQNAPEAAFGKDGQNGCFGVLQKFVVIVIYI